MKWTVKIDKVALKASAKITKKDRDRILQFIKVDSLNVDNQIQAVKPYKAN